MDREFVAFFVVAVAFSVATALALTVVLFVTAAAWVNNRPQMKCIELRGSWSDGVCIFNTEKENG